ncbi:hypothetical protein COLO4_08265 [Corchorus olitorius]|uniref:Uncharacterized protein n=1 Tax=Corchorus olitorius TaxID=93759 RepID=A0A1R3KGH0_9ROSI|nr:hypothetical protein COLO4_08265 [Corchorus olitorius]
MTDLRDEALCRAKKKYKKRRSEESPEHVTVSGSDEISLEGVAPVGSSGTVPLKRESYRDHVTRNFVEENSADVDGSEQSAANQDSTKPSEESMLIPEFGPWMIVHGVKDEFKEGLKEKSKSFNLAKSREKIKESTGKGRSKGLNKEANPSSTSRLDTPKPYSVPGPNFTSGPPPGFSFKGGLTENVTFDLKRLEDLVGSSHFKLSHLMGQQNSTVNTEFLKEDGLPNLMESTGGEVDMVLLSDAISLPPQQPPTVASENLVPNLSKLIHDDMVADVSARLISDQNVSAMDGAQSKEPDSLDTNLSSFF